MDRIDEAMTAVPREEFLPEGERARATHDGPLPIGHGQTSSQPRTVTDMLRLLDVQPGQRILDVGAGSGWTTALLAQLTTPNGAVVGVEIEQELALFGSANLAAWLERRAPGVTPWARIEPARPDVLGLPSAGPYDRILVSAEAEEVPPALVDQIADGGRMVIPVRGQMLLVRLTATPEGREVETSQHGSYRFVPLRGVVTDQVE